MEPRTRRSRGWISRSDAAKQCSLWEAFFQQVTLPQRQSTKLKIETRQLVVFSLAVYSFYDFAGYGRSKNPGDIKLKLPEKIRYRIRKIMSKQMRTRNIVVGALSLGVVVSLLESVCTGQVYLPTILCISRDPNLAVKGIACLVLYNVMFIVPLLAVFGMAYCRLTSERLAVFSRRHIGLSKVLLGILFLGLGAILIATVV